MARPAWLTYAAAAAMVLVTGLGYCLSLYALDFVVRAGGTPDHLAAIGIAHDVGLFLTAPLVGLLIDYAGSRVTGPLALALHAGTLLAMWLLSAFRVSLHWVVVCGLFTLLGIGETLAATTAIVVVVQRLSAHHEGIVVATLQAFSPVGGIVAAFVHLAFAGPSDTQIPSFLLVMCAAATVVDACGSWILASPRASDFSERDDAHPRNTPARQMLRSPAFYVLAGTVFVGTGIGLTAINTSSLLVDVEASGVSPQAFVAILATSTAAVRLITGPLSDLAYDRGAPRASGIIGSTLIVTGAAIAVVAGYSGIGMVVLAGIAYGAFAPLGALTLLHLFGKRFFGENSGFLALAPGAGSIVFGTIASELYVRGPCAAAACFRDAYIIALCMCALALAAAIVLVVYERRVSAGSATDPAFAHARL